MNIDKVLQKLRIDELNEMQQAACKTILGTQRDVVILSPTGSGKTLAYLLPTAHLVDENSNNVQVIVVVPGRELALQSGNVLKSMACSPLFLACPGLLFQIKKSRNRFLTTVPGRDILCSRGTTRIAFFSPVFRGTRPLMYT